MSPEAPAINPNCLTCGMSEDEAMELIRREMDRAIDDHGAEINLCGRCVAIRGRGIRGAA